MNAQYVKCDIQEIAAWVELSKKEQLVFNENTQLYKVIINGEFIGFTGIQKIGRKCIFKNSWIIKEHRGNGYYREIVKWKMSQCIGYRIEATCTKMSINIYLEFGFKPVKKYKNGCTKVVYENQQ